MWLCPPQSTNLPRPWESFLHTAIKFLTLTVFYFVQVCLRFIRPKLYVISVTCLNKTTVKNYAEVSGQQGTDSVIRYQLLQLVNSAYGKTKHKAHVHVEPCSQVNVLNKGPTSTVPQQRIVFCCKLNILGLITNYILFHLLTFDCFLQHLMRLSRLQVLHKKIFTKTTFTLKYLAILLILSSISGNLKDEKRFHRNVGSSFQTSF